MVLRIASRVHRVQRGLLREDQVKKLLLHRYGSTHRFDREVLSYAQVAQVSGVAASTVRASILRFHINGNRFLPRTGQGRKFAIPLHV